MLNLSDRRIAQIKLSVKDLKRMAVDEILKDESAKIALEGKRFKVESEWHVFKWDEPGTIVTFTLVEES